jgi:hypothetical protein
MNQNSDAEYKLCLFIRGFNECLVTEVVVLIGGSIPSPTSVEYVRTTRNVCQACHYSGWVRTEHFHESMKRVCHLEPAFLLIII